MLVDIREESADDLNGYASVPIAFEVSEILEAEVQQNGLGGFSLRRRAVGNAYVKDYDALDGGPRRWAERFDLSNWCFFAAYHDRQRVGGAAFAFGNAGLGPPGAREDLAVLWDIRVSPDHRGSGVGSALIAAVEARAAARGCRRLMVETQNVNVPACEFYMRHGFVLDGLHRSAYPSLPDEVQLLWCKALMP